MNNQSEITELYKEPTYDELKVVLTNYLNPSATEEVSESTTMSTPSKETSKTVDQVDDAFDKLFAK
jgi:hypothetical protein